MKDINHYQNVLNDKNINITLLEEAQKKNNVRRFLSKCNVCGVVKEKSVPSINKGQKCRCNRRINHNDFLKKVNNIYDGNIELLSKYKTMHDKIKVRYSCGHEAFVKSQSLLSGYGCYECSSNRKLYNSDIIDRFNNEVGDEYTLLGEYVDMKNPIKIRHNTCGLEYNVTMDKFLGKYKRRCPKCSGNGNYRYTPKEFKERFYNELNGSFELLSEYYNMRTKIKVRHECGYEYYTYPNNILNKGRDCPKCSKSPMFSKLEKEVFDYIRSIYDGNVIENYKPKFLKGKEIDIYLPEENLAIEFDGLYWHSDQYVDKNYHLNKTKICLENDIRLIHIFEDEWLNKQDIVKAKLRNLLNLSEGRKIYARKCKIVEVDFKTKNKFLEDNHIQGKDNSSIRLGLEYEDELVAVLTFGKLRAALGTSGNKNQYELIRYAGNRNDYIIGGFSKLLAYFIREYDPEYIKTFADLRWSSPLNNVYDTNNFKLSHQSKPNYWYFRDSVPKRYHRYNFRKNILNEKLENFDKNKTEFQNMDDHGWFRVWDCGNLVYEWNKKEENE
jgi:hypothetical protein